MSSISTWKKVVIIEAVIMAAGKGTRLLPLTADRPKAMVEVKGKPIIHWLLNELRNIGITKVYVIVGYMESKLKSYIKYTFPDIEGEFIHQKEQSGTADAIYLVKDKINDDFIVLSGDIIYSKEEIKKLMQKKNSLLFTHQEERLYEYGTIDFTFKGNSSILFINEKTTRPTSNYINCGAYHFTRDVFDYIENTSYDSRFKEKIITNSINLMISHGIKFNGICIDKLREITYPEDIEEIEVNL